MNDRLNIQAVQRQPSAIGADAPALVLASGSPRRKELLGALGVPFEIVVSDEPETLAPGLTPETQAVALAERKARAVAGTIANGLVLGADTIVVLDVEILGKPADAEDAARMLRRLSGRDHEVVTGLALVDATTGATDRRAVTSIVRVRQLSEGEIVAYVATGEPRDKAGAYAIQGIGSGLIAGFEGCFNNVVGLPLCAVGQMLASAGVALPAAWGGCSLPDGSHCPALV